MNEKKKRERKGEKGVKKKKRKKKREKGGDQWKAIPHPGTPPINRTMLPCGKGSGPAGVLCSQEMELL